MPRVLCAILLMALAVALGACGGGPVATKMAGPADYLMTPPHAFPRIEPGADMAAIVAEAASAHNHNARKIKGLQRYIRTIRKG